MAVVEEGISHTCIYIYDSADRRGSCRGGNFTYMYIYMIVWIDVAVVEEGISHTCIYIYDSVDRRGSCRGGNFTYLYIYI